MAKWRKFTDTNYLKEMLTGQTNVNVALGALAAGSVLAVPFGLAIGLIPLIGYAAGASVASLFVPGSSKFRNKVDRRKHIESREAARAHLLAEIQKRMPDGGGTFGQAYSRMLDRCQSLRRVADEQNTALSHDDVDTLEDATVDYLGLWLGRIAIQERYVSVSREDIQARIDSVDERITRVSSEADRRRLLSAKADLKKLLRRRDEMLSRDSVAEATMLMMADCFDEAFQRVMADPNSRENITSGLKVAVERMNIEEDLDYMLDAEIETLLAGAS